MTKTLSALAVALLLAGQANANPGADLLALDDGALVNGYLAALFREPGTVEATARKIAFHDLDLLNRDKAGDLARKLRAAIELGAIGQADFVINE
jgi:hypothetical protein